MRKHQVSMDMRIDPESVMNAITLAVLVVDENNIIAFSNAASEHLFETGSANLLGHRLDTIIQPDSPVFDIIDKARRSQATFSGHAVPFSSPLMKACLLTVHVSPIPENKSWLAISLHSLSNALQFDQQMNHRNAARSVTAMAALLAHEVKNPLAGIRGAAQFLEDDSSPEDAPLLRLIMEETDRIVALVDQMDMFSDTDSLAREPINIHRVLEHVRMLAENGFAKDLRIIENYDPSLPPVIGNRDQLIQVFLNLVKNAAEAAPPNGGEIVLSTSYQHGLRTRVPGGDVTDLPLVIRVQDNGAVGVPEDLEHNLFDAFVTTKPTGTGLGLPLVAKIVSDHGGMVEFRSRPGKTVFSVILPMQR